MKESHLTRDAHAALLAIKERVYQKMIEEVQDYAILLLGADGTILNWTRGAMAIKGYQEQEVIGKNFRIFYQPVDQEAGLPETLLSMARQNGRASHEGWRVRKNGTTFWGSVVITALRDDNNVVIGYTKVTRDLTDRKLAEEKLTAYAASIEKQNAQLAGYAYIAAHDLQEPLRKILVYSELLEGPLNEATHLKYLSKIKASAGRMSALIRDVLRFSQIPHDQATFQVVDLKEIVDQVMEDYQPFLERGKVHLQVDTLPEVKIVPSQIYQLFSGLLNNAVKFSDGDLQVVIAAELLNENDRQYLMEHFGHAHFQKVIFKDNGIGFEQKYAEYIFGMFKRLNKNLGTGIGLALCRKIMDYHGGAITVDSEVGKGSVFNIFFKSE